MGTIEQYSEVLTRLVTEMTLCIPGEWQHGALTIESDGVRITYRLKAEDQPGKAMISEKLRDLIDELYVRMAHNGSAWSESIIGFTRQNDEVSFNTSFKYSKSAAPSAPMKRPWWKFGTGNA